MKNSVFVWPRTNQYVALWKDSITHLIPHNYITMSELNITIYSIIGTQDVKGISSSHFHKLNEAYVLSNMNCGSALLPPRRLCFQCRVCVGLWRNYWPDFHETKWKVAAWAMEGTQYIFSRGSESQSRSTNYYSLSLTSRDRSIVSCDDIFTVILIDLEIYPDI